MLLWYVPCFLIAQKQGHHRHGVLLNLPEFNVRLFCLMSREGNSGSMVGLMVVNSLWSHGHQKLQLILSNGIFVHILISDSKSKVLDECSFNINFTCVVQWSIFYYSWFAYSFSVVQEEASQLTVFDISFLFLKN